MQGIYAGSSLAACHKVASCRAVRSPANAGLSRCRVGFERHLSIHLSIHPSVHPSIHLSVFHLSIYTRTSFSCNMTYVCNLQRPARKSRQAYALMLCVCVWCVCAVECVCPELLCTQDEYGSFRKLGYLSLGSS